MRVLFLTATSVCLFVCFSVAQSTQTPLKKEPSSVHTPVHEEEDENESAETALEHAKQSWFKLMQKPNANYFKIERKFLRYFKKHPLEGSGPKEYGVSWLKKKIFYLDVKGRV